MGIRRIVYIHHSGYYIEMDNFQLLLDYYEGSLQMLKTEKPLIVLASHSHGDHFSPKIFKLAEKNRFSRLLYVLSPDIPRSSVPAACRPLTQFIGPHERISLPILSAMEQPAHLISNQQTQETPVTSQQAQKHTLPEQQLKGMPVTGRGQQSQANAHDPGISTLRSNDQGVAFIIQAEGVHIYFAGDLNDWYWDGDSEDLELEQQYLTELGRIRGMRFDAAFIPVDPRLKDPCLGVIRFMEYADAKKIFPMHMWDHYDVIENLLRRPETVSYRNRIAIITGDNAQFVLNR